MTSILKIGAPVVAAILLTSCAASYQEPAGTATARIRLASSKTSMGGGNIHMNGYASGKCEAPVRIGMVGGIARLSNEVPLGIPGSEALPPKSFVERKIPAGQRYLFTMRALVGNGACVATTSFVPAAGKDYEIRLEWNLQERTCHASLKRVEKNASGEVVLEMEPSFVRELECHKGLT